MFYKPKFCCNCGEKIERVEWRPWTSGRFCGVCETEFVPHDYIPRLVVVVGILAGLFGAGAYFQSPAAKTEAESKPAPLVSRAKQQPQTQRGETAVQNVNAANAAAKETAPERSLGQTVPVKESSDEPVYFCGATTKKGAPCTRRVKVKGRCWQHARNPSASLR